MKQTFVPTTMYAENLTIERNMEDGTLKIGYDEFSAETLDEIVRFLTATTEVAPKLPRGYKVVFESGDFMLVANSKYEKVWYDGRLWDFDLVQEDAEDSSILNAHFNINDEFCRIPVSKDVEEYFYGDEEWYQNQGS